MELSRRIRIGLGVALALALAACEAADPAVGDAGGGAPDSTDSTAAADDTRSDVAAAPAPDPLDCELTDWGYGPIWDGTVDCEPVGPEPEGLTGITEAHNAVRRFVGVPELAWSGTLAGDAQAWADHLKETMDCGMMHDTASGQGENLAAGAGTWSGFRLTPRGVVGGWSCEREDWDNEALTCRGEPGLGDFPRSCGHYTQVVWETTREVGCGVATCPGPYMTAQILVCRYLPAGNRIGAAPF